MQEDRIHRALEEDLEKDPLAMDPEEIEAITGGGEAMEDTIQGMIPKTIHQTRRMKLRKMITIEGEGKLKGGYTWCKALKDHQVRMERTGGIIFPQLMETVKQEPLTQSWLQPLMILQKHWQNLEMV